jgi:lipoprotein-anchoring transpeptidase ErfK/SrfK
MGFRVQPASGPRAWAWSAPVTAAVMAAVMAAVLAGCGSGPAPGQPGDPQAELRAGGASPPSPGESSNAGTATRAADRPGGPSPDAQGRDFPAYSVTATRARVDVRSAPGGPVVRTLSSPLPSGAPLTFLLDRRKGGWLRVLLPVRPNGSTGWIRAGDGKLLGLPYRLDVSRSKHVLRLYRFGRLQRTFPVGIGTRDTPTPGGTFFLKELLAPTNADGVYGPFAYGLSGFSSTLDSFAGGDAVIGLHGTNTPSSVGRDVSHGCIRMLNEDITVLAHTLPLGTPVRILA